MSDLNSSSNSKKTIVIVIIVAVIIAIGLIFYLSINRPTNITPKTLSQEEITKKNQLEKLDNFYKNSGSKSLTEGEKKKQIEELDKLRKRSLQINK